MLGETHIPWDFLSRAWFVCVFFRTWKRAWFRCSHVAPQVETIGVAGSRRVVAVDRSIAVSVLVDPDRPPVSARPMKSIALLALRYCLPFVQQRVEGRMAQSVNPALTRLGIKPLDMKELQEGSKFAVRAITEAM